MPLNSGTMGLFDASKQKGKKKGNQQNSGKPGFQNNNAAKGNNKGAGKSTRIASRGQRGS